ncbi:hypothetical protein KC909_05215, partial [Candidatus Dojkabacteria bacterium]|nr:hypothetical protein [Candidatus Dojkabacteria bacterium]
QNAASSQNQTEPQDQQQPTQQQDSAKPDAPVQQVDTVKGTVSNGVLKKSIRAAVKPISDKTTGRLAKRYRGALDRRDEYSDNGLAGRFTLKALYKEMRKERAAYQNNKIFQSRAEMLDEALSTGNVILLTQLPKIPKQKGYGKIFRKQLKESVKDNSVLLLYAGADLLGAGVRKASGAIKDGTPESLKSTIVKSKTKIRDAKKKAKDSTKELGSFIATQAIKRIILRPIEQIREVVEQVRETGRGLSRYRLARRFVNSNTGQWVSTKFSNFKNTRIGSGLSNILKLESVDDVHSGMSRVGGSITRVYRSGSDLLMRSATSTGAILKGGIGVARIGGAYVSALPYGILGAIGAGAVAFGTLGAGAVVPAAAVGGSVLVAAKGTDNFLRLDPTKFARIAYDPAATPTLFRPFVRASAYISNGARNFLIRNGYGQFFTQDAAVTRFNYGAANTQQGQYALVGNRGNIYSGFARGVRAINSGLTVGSIFAVGGLALGVNPLLAGAVGVGVGVGGRLAIDAFRGSRLYNAINLGSKVPAWANALSHIPANAILGSTLGNIWLGNQIGILRNQYGGNVLEYFKGEYIDGLGNLKGDPAGFLMAAGNWLGAAGYISSAKALAAFGGTAAASVATRLGVTVPAGTSLTAPVLAGTAVGTLVGLGIALAFGLPLTTTVITGALIGGAIGGTIGGVLGGVATFFTGGALAPTVFWFATAGASIGSTIGAWIGSTVENAFNDIFKGYLSALNGLSSLMALFHLLKAGMDMDQIVPLALAIITLASMLNKGGILQASNECLPEDEVCTGVNPLAAEGINEMYIAHYNVTLIGVDATVWTQDNIKTVLRALNDVGSDTIAERTSGKKIYITLGEEGTYVEDKFILIGFSNTAFSSPEEFAEIFTNELNSIANTTPTIEQTTSLNFQ